MRLILLITAAGLTLTACATAAPERQAAELSGGRYRTDNAYGLFLGGNAALNAGRAKEAERLFARARTAAPGNTLISTRAFTAALAAGDIPRAVASAPGADADAATQSLVRLARAVDALASNRHAEAYALLNGEAFTPPHSLAAALVKPWAAAAAGQPLPAPNAAADGPLADVLSEVGGLELLERAGRHAEADAQVAALDPAGASVHTVLTHGEYLERRRRAADAASLYERALATRPESEPLQAALARARAGRTPPAAPTVREGAAEGLLIPALVLAGARQGETALAYLRLSLHLDPKRDEAWMALGETLAAAGDLEGARRAFMTLKPDSPGFAASRARLALALQEAGRREEALETARTAAAAAPNDETVQEAYAGLLADRGQYDEAVAVFDKLLATPKGQANWRLWYLRGAAHERAGRWPMAERDMSKALELAPEEPEVLNYLGYSWVDRGERLQQAMGMIERAARLRPRSGAIVDSLGWAHYRLGNFSEAVTRLERAAELEPGDPTINDHLGDAYWRAGRKIEAQFQWRRVLTLEPEPKLKSEVEAKLASPEGPDGVARAVASGT